MIKVTVTPDAPASIRAISHTVFPKAPDKIWLRLPSDGAGETIAAAVEKRPGFRGVFSGVLVDWSYLSVRTEAALASDSRWLAALQLGLGVDLSSAIDMFPGLRLGNFTSSGRCAPGTLQARLGVCREGEFYEQSMATIRDVMRKSSLMGAADLLLTLHQAPELGPNASTVTDEMTKTVKQLAGEAAALTPPVKLHLRQSRKNQMLAGSTTASQHSWARQQGLGFAANSGLAASDGTTPQQLLAFLRDGKESAIFLLDGVEQHEHGTETAPLGGTAAGMLQRVKLLLAAARLANATVALDPTWSTASMEEADRLWLEQALRPGGLPPLPPPPPPKPPPSPKPGTHCYEMGIAEPGICQFYSANQGSLIEMGCPPGQACYADYMMSAGTWAGAFGDRFGGMITSANAMQATTTITSVDGKWVLAVALGNRTESWSGAPAGYMAPGTVVHVACGGDSKNRSAFGCVK